MTEDWHLRRVDSNAPRVAGLHSLDQIGWRSPRQPRDLGHLMRRSRSLVTVALATLVLTSTALAQGARGGRPVSRDAVMHAADSIANAAIKSGRVAALSIAVTRGKDTLVMKGYGMADIENEVPATAQTVYRIGSVTKQFTSVAIMQLDRAGQAVARRRRHEVRAERADTRSARSRQSTCSITRRAFRAIPTSATRSGASCGSTFRTIRWSRR